MNNDITIFTNPQFGDVRVVGEWFVAKDVADILGYQNGSRDVNRHVDETDRADLVIHDGSQNRTMTGINESGVYALIFGSTLPAAKDFKRWVTSEVLPSIRKHGAYMTTETAERIMADPDVMIQLLEALKAERALAALYRHDKHLAEKQVAELTPKAEFYDAVAGSRDAIAIGVLAKVLAVKGLGQNNLFKRLRELNILDRDNIPHQEYVDRGYFRLIEQKFTVPSGETRIHIKTLVFPKGQDWIRKQVSA